MREEGALQSHGLGQELPMTCGCCWHSLPGLAWPTAANTHSHTPWPSSPAPRACSPGLPLSLHAHSCACLLPSLGALGPQAGEWIFPASVNKWWQHARWVGDRGGGAAPQPGCAKHRGTAWGGGDGETPRERERHSEADRQTQGSLVGHR